MQGNSCWQHSVCLRILPILFYSTVSQISVMLAAAYWVSSGLVSNEHVSRNSTIFTVVRSQVHYDQRCIG